jgi:hypothetical protein
LSVSCAFLRAPLNAKISLTCNICSDTESGLLIPLFHKQLNGKDSFPYFEMATSTKKSFNKPKLP